MEQRCCDVTQQQAFPHQTHFRFPSVPLQTMSATLWQETLALGEDYITLCCSSRWLAPLPPSRSAAAMRHLAEDLERQHQEDLHDLARRLTRQGADPCADLSRVMAEVSGDGHLNWGRVVSIFSFAGVVAKQLRVQRSQEVRRGEESEEGEQEASMNHRLAVAIADYLAGEKRDWLLEHNGWVSVRHEQSMAEGASLILNRIFLFSPSLAGWLCGVLPGCGPH